MTEPITSSLRDVLRSLYDENGGSLTPQIVLTAARPVDSVLHQYFEWDDSAAAEKYRLAQAGNLIRRVKIKVETSEGDTYDVRAFVHVPATANPAADIADPDDTANAPSATYLPEDVARRDAVAREIVLRQMRRDWTSFKRRYEHLQEFWNLMAEEEFETRKTG